MSYHSYPKKGTGSTPGAVDWGDITGTLSNQTDLQTALNGKQATLVSGTNIKTINSTSILGSGDITISGTAVWGGITGTLSDQTDLNSALSGKQDTLGFTPENVANKSVNLTSPDDTKYPTTLAVSSALSGKQDTGNYITDLTGDVTASGPGSVAATIANDAVTTSKIADANVTLAKIAPGSSELSVLKVRDGAASWEVDWTELTKKRSDKEAGVFKTIEWFDDDATPKLRKKSVLSGGTAPQFTTRTVTFYDTDGSTVLDTVVFALSYDGDGDLEEEELQ